METIQKRDEEKVVRKTIRKIENTRRGVTAGINSSPIARGLFLPAVKQ